MSLDERDLAIIDQRIRLASQTTRATGTIISRDTTGSGCMVLFDGATVPTPAKVTGSAYVQESYRCLLDRYGASEWVVTHAWSATSFGEANLAYNALPGATGPLTSGAHVDLSEFPSFTFTKYFDLTFVRMQITVGGFVTGSVPTRATWGLRFTPIEGGIDYTPADLILAGINFNVASDHRSVTMPARYINIPAGTYTVQLRWRRHSGTGSVFADTNDSYAVEVDERVRAATPTL